LTFKLKDSDDKKEKKTDIRHTSTTRVFNVGKSSLFLEDG